MASALYDLGRNAFAKAGINWQAGGDTIRATLVSNLYVANLTAHQYFSDIGAANVHANVGANDRANCVEITGKSAAAGVCDGANVVFTTVPANAGNLNAIVIFKDAGADGNSALIAYIDTGTGLPVTPNGGDITVAWDDGANKIFKL